MAITNHNCDKKHGNPTKRDWPLRKVVAVGIPRGFWTSKPKIKRKDHYPAMLVCGHVQWGYGEYEMRCEKCYELARTDEHESVS